MQLGHVDGFELLYTIKHHMQLTGLSLADHATPPQPVAAGEWMTVMITPLASLDQISVYKPTQTKSIRSPDHISEQSTLALILVAQWHHDGFPANNTSLATLLSSKAGIPVICLACSDRHGVGVEYKIIQPHRSQGDWTPPVTPALWGRIQGERHHHREEKWGEDCKPLHAPPDYGQQQQQQQQVQCQVGDQPSYQASAVQPAQEQQEKHWYESPRGIIDKHKKEFEIGGGILAGVAALGAGYYAYKHHEKKSEEEEAQAWSASKWVEDSRIRTQQWRAGQYNGPVAWIWNEGRSIPRDAIQGGEERGEVLYICRAYHESGLLVGKASRVFKKGAVIGFKKDEIHIDEYEILVGDSRAVRWVPCSGQLNLQGLRARPVEGGREPDGTPIYIAQAPHHGAVHPGKACETYGDGCFIPYDNSEKKVKEYAVLCYA
ncbi:hypothetical protein J3R82DRAFT_10742 [Butyriboletus roseoflavus]|nr:hypothetical protein J3R82DRAFT_10742 [Butyriboletus roseoflavus]